MVVEESVGHEPRAPPEVRYEPFGRPVGERAARAVEREKREKRGDAEHENEDREHCERERTPLERDGHGVEGLVLADLRDEQKPPVRDEVCRSERDERARNDGEESVRTQQLRRR